MSKNFKGMTAEYRETAEYKNLYALLKQDYPDLPQYLLELAMTVDKQNPKFSKQYFTKEQKETKVIDPSELIVNTVQIYENEEDVPKAEPVKNVEY